MPLSKPVKYEIVKGYPYADFVSRTEEEKKKILQSMSIENLTSYIEGLITDCSLETPKTSITVFKQIAESEFQSNYPKAEFNKILNDFLSNEESTIVDNECSVGGKFIRSFVYDFSF